MSAEPAVEFRFATLDDVEVIHRLVESTYRGDGSRAGWTTEADLIDGQRIDTKGIVDIIQEPESVVLLAEIKGRIVGCCQLEQRTDHGYLGMFSVDTTLQGRGLGRAIVGEAERLASEEWKLGEMRMTVLRQRPDILAWYDRMGYRSDGTTAPFPYGDATVGQPKRDDLEFFVLRKPLA